MKIISGGQTGVDEVALRAALDCGFDIGGWCPPGKTCESGKIPDIFPLQETLEERSPRAPHIPRSLRTEWNVRDSDGTLILESVKPSDQKASDPGTWWTLECAKLYGKPILICEVKDRNIQMVRDWIRNQGIKTLNVAGPAESTRPGIGQIAERFLKEVFKS